ncbi:MAG: hypothetical protein JJT76_09040 [Clostridiaceae bacterium]|nr:hypothetical protein [Clostridiaceae bacterium]
MATIFPRLEKVVGRKKEAQLALQGVLQNLRGGYVEPQKMTAHDYLTDWLENYIKENRKINTYQL